MPLPSKVTKLEDIPPQYKHWRELWKTDLGYRQAWIEGRGPGQSGKNRKRHQRHTEMELGDVVEKALSLVGITEVRVTKWLGRDCGCGGRKARLNQLSRWAKRVAKGRLRWAKRGLEKLIRGKRKRK